MAVLYAGHHATAVAFTDERYVRPIKCGTRDEQGDGSGGVEPGASSNSSVTEDLNVQTLVVGVGMEVLDITVPARWLY